MLPVAPASDSPVQHRAKAGTHEPGEWGDCFERRDQGYGCRHDRRDHKDENGPAVDAPLVPVRSGRPFLVERVDVDAPPLYEVVVDEDDAEQRTEKGTQAAQEVVYRNRAVVDVPRRHQEGEESRDQASTPEVYVLR